MSRKLAVREAITASPKVWAAATILTGALIVTSGCTSSPDRTAAPTPGSSTQQQTSSANPAGANPSSTPSTTDTSSAGQATAKPDFPPAVAPSALKHGSTYWGVYVTVVRTDDKLQIKPDDQKRLDAAAKSLTDLGYKPDAGAYDIGCEQGMREQLRLDPQRSYGSVRIFFAEQSQAQRFVTAYQPGVVGTAKVTLYCMD